MIAFLIFTTILIAGIVLDNWMMVAASCTMIIFLCLACIVAELSKSRKALEEIARYYKDKYSRGE